MENNRFGVAGSGEEMNFLTATLCGKRMKDIVILQSNPGVFPSLFLE